MPRLTYGEYASLILHDYLQKLLFSSAQTEDRNSGCKVRKVRYRRKLNNRQLKFSQTRQDIRILLPEPLDKNLQSDSYVANSADTFPTYDFWPTLSKEDADILTEKHASKGLYLPDSIIFDETVLNLNTLDRSVLNSNALDKSGLTTNKLDAKYYLLPVVSKDGKLKHVFLTFPIACSLQAILETNIWLTPHPDLLILLYQSQHPIHLYVAIRFGARTLKLSHEYILSHSNPIADIIELYSCWQYNLIKTEDTIVPISQIPNWKLLTLFAKQKKHPFLELIDYKNFLLPNQPQKILLSDDSVLTFDENSGILNIFSKGSAMHRSNFIGVHYIKRFSLLCFQMLLSDQVFIFLKLDADATEFVENVNNWVDCRLDKYKIYFYKKVSYDNFIIHSGMVQYNDKENFFLILYYDRLELYGVNRKHKIRFYLNNQVYLKYKLYLSAKWNDVCVLRNELEESNEWFLTCISYIYENNAEVTNIPKVLRFCSENVLETKTWLSYIHYLKIVI